MHILTDWKTVNSAHTDSDEMARISLYKYRTAPPPTLTVTLRNNTASDVDAVHHWHTASARFLWEIWMVSYEWYLMVSCPFTFTYTGHQVIQFLPGWAKKYWDWRTGCWGVKYGPGADTRGYITWGIWTWWRLVFMAEKGNCWWWRGHLDRYQLFLKLLVHGLISYKGLFSCWFTCKRYALLQKVSHKK